MRTVISFIEAILTLVILIGVTYTISSNVWWQGLIAVGVFILMLLCFWEMEREGGDAGMRHCGCKENKLCEYHMKQNQGIK